MALLGKNDEYSIRQIDCIEHMHEMPENSVDMSVFSPPFASVYAYGDAASDLGNSEDFKGDAKLHLSFFYKALVRVMKPGRVACVHVAQIPRMKRTGMTGVHDFRGLNIRLGERAGFTYEYEWSIRKNPQAQAIRTRSRELQFNGLEADRSKSRGAMPDFIIKFRKPGENKTPIAGDGAVSRNDWIRYAEHHWSDIRETDTLNVAEGRDNDDTKHICPLQLSVIARLVKLFSLPNEIVFSPFTGIGSEGHESLRLDRRFYGCEIKDTYYQAAIKNCERAIKQRGEQLSLFESGDVRKFAEKGGLCCPEALVVNETEL